MKKYFLLSLIMIFWIFCIPVFSQDNSTSSSTNDNGNVNKMFVICSPNKRLCTVGKHTMTSGGQPLFITDGIVCSSDRRTCTNGFSYITSSEPIEIIASSVLCTKNRQICTIGKHRITSNKKDSLYVEDGIVCTSDKKMCTNGFSYMRSGVPLR